MATEERATNWHERDYARRFVYGELPIPYLHMEEFVEAATSVAILFAEHVATLAVAPPSGETPPNDKYADDLIATIKSWRAPQAGGWIAVAERLPEIGQIVLAYKPESTQPWEIVEYSAKAEQHRTLIRSDGQWWDCGKQITHWKPLDSPPALPSPPGKEGQ